MWTRRLLDNVLLTGIIAAGLADAGGQLVRPVQDDAPVERIVSAYSALASSFDAGTRVGFIGAGSDPTTVTMARYLAQYALAPLVLRRGADQEWNLAVLSDGAMQAWEELHEGEYEITFIKYNMYLLRKRNQ